MSKIGPKEAQLAALREKPASPTVARTAPEPVAGEQVAAPPPEGAADPAIVAKAVPFYLQHLKRSREGMRAHRAKLAKKKKRKAPKKS